MMFRLTSPRLSSRSVSVILLAIAALGVFAFLSVAAAQSECVQSLDGNGAVSGSWTSDCLSESTPTEPTDPPPGTRYARFYSFALTEQSNVTITLESGTDPYLFLLDSDGVVLSENDDISTSGGNYNSRIEMTLDLGDYTIEATTYSREATGDFTLTLSGLPAAEEAQPTPTQTPSADECVSTLTSETTGGSWTDECSSRNREAAYARFYVFTLGERSDVTVTLESDTDTYLYLLDGDGDVVAENDDIDREGGDYDSRIRVTLDPGDNTIEATTYSAEATGEFTLTAAGIDLAASNPTPEPTPTTVPATSTAIPTPDPTSEPTPATLPATSTSTPIPEQTPATVPATSTAVPTRQQATPMSTPEQTATTAPALEPTATPTPPPPHTRQQATPTPEPTLTTVPTPEPTATPARSRLHLLPTATPTPVPTPPSASDRAALVALYNSTGGANWTRKDNWLSNRPLGEWDGVITHIYNGRVRNLQLINNNLTGSIPTQLGNLTEMIQLDLHHNELSGSIPAALGNLSNLEYLALRANELSGPIPAALGNLSKLATLDIYLNELSGSIPAELGNLSKLEHLGLSYNELSGSIPAALGNLDKLQFLYLSRNNLTGCIPKGLSDAQYHDLDATGLGFCE